MANRLKKRLLFNFFPSTDAFRFFIGFRSPKLGHFKLGQTLKRLTDQQLHFLKLISDHHWFFF